MTLTDVKLYDPDSTLVGALPARGAGLQPVRFRPPDFVVLQKCT